MIKLSPKQQTALDDTLNRLSSTFADVGDTRILTVDHFTRSALVEVTWALRKDLQEEMCESGAPRTTRLYVRKSGVVTTHNGDRLRFSDGRFVPRMANIMLRR